MSRCYMCPSPRNWSDFDYAAKAGWIPRLNLEEHGYHKLSLHPWLLNGQTALEHLEKLQRKLQGHIEVVKKETDLLEKVFCIRNSIL